MNLANRRLRVCFVILACSLAMVAVGRASPQQSSSVASPKAHEKLPDKSFTHPPEKPHDPAAFYFTFDQLEYWYRVPGEFTRRLTGDPAGVPHTFMNVGSKPFNLIAVFSTKHPTSKRIGPNPLIPAGHGGEEPGSGLIP